MVPVEWIPLNLGFSWRPFLVDWPLAKITPTCGLGWRAAGTEPAKPVPRIFSADCWWRQRICVMNCCPSPSLALVESHALLYLPIRCWWPAIVRPRPWAEKRRLAQVGRRDRGSALNRGGLIIFGSRGFERPLWTPCRRIPRWPLGRCFPRSSGC